MYTDKQSWIAGWDIGVFSYQSRYSDLMLGYSVSLYLFFLKFFHVLDRVNFFFKTAM